MQVNFQSLLWSYLPILLTTTVCMYVCIYIYIYKKHHFENSHLNLWQINCNLDLGDLWYFVQCQGFGYSNSIVWPGSVRMLFRSRDFWEPSKRLDMQCFTKKEQLNATAATCRPQVLLQQEAAVRQTFNRSRSCGFTSLWRKGGLEQLFISTATWRTRNMSAVSRKHSNENEMNALQ